MNLDKVNYKQNIIDKLRDRNRTESTSFTELIRNNNRLYDTIAQLNAENFKLLITNEKLRTGDGTSNSGIDKNALAEISSMEKKLLAQQEELTMLHKRKGEHTQLIVDLNLKIEQQNKTINEKENSLTEYIKQNTSLKAEVNMLTNNIDELKNLNTCLRDEHTALQLAFGALEDKLRKAQDENRTLIDRLIKYKAKDADKMNEENENFLKKRSDKIRRELEDATQETVRRSSSPLPFFALGGIGDRDCGDVAGASAGFYTDALPNCVQMQFDAHEGEVNAAQWSPVERLVATGGADRKVKLFDVGKAKMEPRGQLVGSNAGINSVDFDSTGTMILGTSNDFASRVWTIADQRLRHTLTGHSGKVMAAKFLGEPSKIVTGSHDRTLKIWDLRSRACIETKFAGSSCNDLVTTDGSGSTIISGHFDKKIRFWDTRTDCSANDILLNGKITSLDLSRDFKYLLSCVRDDTIKLLDLRMNQILKTFSNDNYKVSCDWCRVAFSPDGTRVASGAADGSVFIWNIMGRLETTLKEHSNAVTAVCWHPFSSVLASVDRGKKCTIWTNT